MTARRKTLQTRSNKEQNSRFEEDYYFKIYITLFFFNFRYKWRVAYPGLSGGQERIEGHVARCRQDLIDLGIQSLQYGEVQRHLYRVISPNNKMLSFNLSIDRKTKPG